MDAYFCKLSISLINPSICVTDGHIYKEIVGFVLNSEIPLNSAGFFKNILIYKKHRFSTTPKWLSTQDRTE